MRRRYTRATSVFAGFDMRLLVALVMMSFALLIGGCGGGGSSQSAPSNLKVAAGDSSATVTWDYDPGLAYWVWATPGNSIDTHNCASACSIFVNVTPPFIVPNLVNGVPYTITVNARSGTGAGGPGSPSATIVPRLAGAVWNVDPPLGAGALLGTGFIAANGSGISELVDVGAGGAVFWTTDGASWTPSTSGVTSNLNAVQYQNGLFVTMGDMGTILTSPDAITWTVRTSPTANALYALIGNGSGQVVAVGENGTILVSSNSTDWTAANSGTGSNLYGVAFGNGRYVAVGASGTMLTSTDATSWTAITPAVQGDLRSVTYGSATATATRPAVAMFVAVGAAGALVTSADGLTWTAQAPIASGNLTGVTFGTQFIAVGSGGEISTSLDGLSWQPAESGTNADLNTVTFTILTAKSIGVGYEAVGSAGVNLTAF